MRSDTLQDPFDRRIDHLSRAIASTPHQDFREHPEKVMRFMASTGR